MAAEMGKRLLAEVQEVGLDEILQTIRIQHDPEPAYFGIPALDKIINSASAKRTTTNIPSSNPGPPILELIPQAPGSGTTHLLYFLTATAILSASLGGKDSCVAIVDTDNTFSVSRLVRQLRVAIRSLDQDQHGSEKDQHSSKGTISEAEADASEKTTLNSALRHVHIFRPQSQTSLLATLDFLPAYFLQPSQQSAHRSLAFIALASLPAFHWQQRAESETKAFEEETQLDPQPLDSTPPPPPPKTLPNLLHLLSRSFPSTPLLITNPSHFPRLSSFSSHQSHPPKIIPLTLSRAQTRPFPPMISLTEALREKEQREIAVHKAGWWVGSSSIPANGGGTTMGFEMKITSEKGVWVVES